jgi:hypothetical protein
MPWLDLGLKLLIPVLLTVFLVASLKLGSLNAYWQILKSQNYTSFLPALRPPASHCTRPWALLLLGSQGQGLIN